MKFWDVLNLDFRRFCKFKYEFPKKFDNFYWFLSNIYDADIVLPILHVFVVLCMFNNFSKNLIIYLAFSKILNEIFKHFRNISNYHRSNFMIFYKY